MVLMVSVNTLKTNAAMLLPQQPSHLVQEGLSQGKELSQAKGKTPFGLVQLINTKSTDRLVLRRSLHSWEPIALVAAPSELLAYGKTDDARLESFLYR